MFCLLVQRETRNTTIFGVQSHLEIAVFPRSSTSSSFGPSRQLPRRRAKLMWNQRGVLPFLRSEYRFCNFRKRFGCYLVLGWLQGLCTYGAVKSRNHGAIPGFALRFPVIPFDFARFSSSQLDCDICSKLFPFPQLLFSASSHPFSFQGIGTWNHWVRPRGAG